MEESEEKEESPPAHRKKTACEQNKEFSKKKHLEVLSKLDIDENFKISSPLSVISIELFVSMMALEPSMKKFMLAIKNILNVEVVNDEKKEYVRFGRLAAKVKKMSETLKTEDKSAFMIQAALDKSFFNSSHTDGQNSKILPKKRRIVCDDEIVDFVDVADCDKSGIKTQSLCSTSQTNSKLMDFEKNIHKECDYKYEQQEKKYRNLQKIVKRLRVWKMYRQTSASKSESKNESLRNANNEVKKVKRSLESSKLALHAAKAKLIEKHELNVELQSKLDDYSELTVHLKEGKSFSNSTAFAVMRLQDLNVASSKMGEVMEVVGDLVGVKIDNVPSPSTCRNYALASRHLAATHIQSRLNDSIADGESVCLVSDETTKGTMKLQTFGYHSANGTFTCLEIARVAEKSAQTAFNALEAALNQLPNGQSDLFTKFMVQVRSTMSDAAHTELKFNKLVENFRGRVIPEMVENYAEWTDNEKDEFSKFSHFFCQLHVISNYTKIVLKSLLEHELALDNSKKLDEPSVFILIKLVSQLFGQRGSGLHGILTAWAPWCKEKLICRFVFESFLGNRFNIVFFLASRVFFHRNHLREFAEEYENGKPELKRVRELLENPMIIEHLQVLGICDQLVTGPLWRLAEGAEHVLNTCHYAKQLIDWLNECVQFPGSFFDGVSPVPNLQVNSPTTSSLLLRELVDFVPSNIGLQVAILISRCSLEYFSRAYADFLPGGVHCDEADEIREHTKSAPATNKSVESVFGLISHLFDTKPNMRLDVRVAITLIRKNHTFEWLKSLSKDEQEEILSKSRAALSAMKRDAKDHEALMSKLILQQLREKTQIATKKLSKQAKDRLSLTTDIVRIGFFETDEDIENALKKLKTEKMRRETIITQLRYRQKVLVQVAPTPKFYNVTSAQKPIPLLQLIEKLRFLQELDVKGGNLPDHELVGKRVMFNVSARIVFIEDVRHRNNRELVTLQYEDDGSPLQIPLDDLSAYLSDGTLTLLP